MPSLTYYKSVCIRDHDCYSVRQKTKKEVVKVLENCDREDFGPIVKVLVTYDSVLDLLFTALGEDGVYEEQVR